MKEMVDFFKALGCEWRIRLVEILSENNKCMCEIEAEFPIDKTTLSRHLKALKDAGIVREERDGARKNLFVTDERILAVIELVKKIAEDRKADSQAGG